jgi:hypothetical protein
MPNSPEAKRLRKACLEKTKLVGIALVLLLALYTALVAHNDSSFHEEIHFCLDMNEANVFPVRNDSVLIDPPPFSTGELLFDKAQLQLRWSLSGTLGSSVTQAVTLSIHGPRLSSHVAPVILTLPDVNFINNNYLGSLDITEELLAQILKTPRQYYIAFRYTHNNYEIVRDELGHFCDPSVD